MRFLLYNIRYGAGIGKRFHLPFPYSGYLKWTHKNLKKISDFIKSAKPDIVGLIEVDSGSFRSRKLNQAETIAEEIGHFHVYRSKYSDTSLFQKIPLLNKQGNAFLTREDIKAKRFHYFKEGVKRLIIELELEEIKIFLVHLSLKFRQRQRQLHTLHTLIKDEQKAVMVAGDFNIFRGDLELELFLASTGLVSSDAEKRPSHPSRLPKRQLDYIFHSPGIRVTHFEIPKVKFSDHMPLVCDFEIIPRKPKSEPKSA